MKKRRIKKIAVIGSGIMGSGIACHFANIGVEVLLLDIVPRELSPAEKERGLTLESSSVRNRIVNSSLEAALKSNPSPIYHKEYAKRISTGNLEDDIHRIKEADWVIEVVVERLDIKKQVFEKIEAHRRPGSLVTSNTSGIPIRLMNEGRSEDFQQHFAVTHFFNPPRYLKLFEVVPGPGCKAEVVDFLMEYGEKYLGKTSVLAKDTPAFIGNRIGIFGIMSLFHIVKDMGLTVEEVDKLTGPLIGRPKSATFRTIDVVGLDTLVHTANGVAENAPEDEMHETFKIPDFVQKIHVLAFGNMTDGASENIHDMDAQTDNVRHTCLLSTGWAGPLCHHHIFSCAGEFHHDNPASRRPPSGPKTVNQFNGHSMVTWLSISQPSSGPALTLTRRSPTLTETR